MASLSSDANDAKGSEDSLSGPLTALDLEGEPGDQEMGEGVEPLGGANSIPAHLRQLDGASLGDSLKLNRERLNRKKDKNRVDVRHPTFRDLSISTSGADTPDPVSKERGAVGVTFDSAEVVHSPSIAKSLSSRLTNATDSMKLHRAKRRQHHVDASSALQPPQGRRTTSLAKQQNIDITSGEKLPSHVQNLASRLSNTTDSMKMNRRRMSGPKSNKQEAAAILSSPDE